MKNKFYKMSFILTSLICIIGIRNTYAIEVREKEITKQYQEWLALPIEEQKNIIEPRKYSIDIQQSNTEKLRNIAYLRLMGNNSRYDLREHIQIKLKDQKQTSQCWAFGMTTALETNVAINENKIVEYSPRHIDYSTSRTFKDGINPLGHSREVGLGFLGTGGGNVLIASSYITSGRGPVLEEDMPFVNSEEKINLSEIQGKKVQLKINSTIEFPNIFKEKKDGIITYMNADGEEYTRK